MKSDIIFYQMFETETSTYTYLLADPVSRDGLIIDPVLKTVARDLKLVEELGIKLKLILETHVHADHITGAGLIAKATGAKIGLSELAMAEGADIKIKDGQSLECGALKIRALSTPGHTNSCMCYYTSGRVFTGDTLMIRTNGRTDFQEGSPERLFESINEKLYKLPDDTEVYPAHDYQGYSKSTIELEKKFNKRISAQRPKAEFVQIMKDLKLPMPQKINEAVPANLKCGREVAG